VVGLMYVMLLLGSIVSALIFGALLQDFTPGRLIEVIQGSAVATIVLNLLALWKQELRRPLRGAAPKAAPSFRDSWGSFASGAGALRRLVAVGLGTMAFSMQDVLLEPYGGQVLNLTVSATTVLTATLAAGGLLGFWLASRVLGKGADAFRIASHGALCGMLAFAAVIAAASLHSPLLFGLGVLGIGFGGGLFGHGTLTATMNHAPPEQAGLALGAWGAVQATAAGIAVALGGIGRDLVQTLVDSHRLPAVWTGPATGYIAIYGLEVLLLLVTLVAMAPLIRRSRRHGAVLGVTPD
jgi:BCD family chlorophyll transporter-like MFS transporter